MFILVILLLLLLAYQIEPFQIKKDNKLCNIIGGPDSSLIVVCDNKTSSEFKLISSEYKKVNPNIKIYNYPDLYKSFYNKQYVIQDSNNCKLTYSPSGALLDKGKYHATMVCDNNIPTDYQQMILSKCGDSYRIHPKNRKNCYLKEVDNKLIFLCYDTPASAIKIGDSFVF